MKIVNKVLCKIRGHQVKMVYHNDTNCYRNDHEDTCYKCSSHIGYKVISDIQKIQQKLYAKKQTLMQLI